MFVVKTKTLYPESVGEYKTRVLIQQEEPSFHVYEGVFDEDVTSKTDDELIKMCLEKMYQETFPNRAEAEAVKTLEERTLAEVNSMKSGLQALLDYKNTVDARLVVLENKVHNLSNTVHHEVEIEE